MNKHKEFLQFPYLQKSQIEFPDNFSKDLKS